MPLEIPRYPTALVPAFTTRKPNQPLTFWKGTMRLATSTRSDSGTGTVQYNWLPQPGTSFALRHGTPFLGVGPGMLRFGSTELPVMVTQSGAMARGGPGSRGSIRGGRVTYSDARARKLRLHLANFMEFHGAAVERVTARHVYQWAGRHEFTAAGWHVVVDSIREADQALRSRLKAEGGYAITHVVEVERADRRVIAESAIATMLEVIGYVFSFSNGAWCMPLMIQALDNRDALAWHDLGTRLIAPWRPRRPWIHPDAFDLSTLFAGVLARHEETAWTKPRSSRSGTTRRMRGREEARHRGSSRAGEAALAAPT